VLPPKSNLGEIEATIRTEIDWNLVPPLLVGAVAYQIAEPLVIFQVGSDSEVETPWGVESGELDSPESRPYPMGKPSEQIPRISPLLMPVCLSVDVKKHLTYEAIQPLFQDTRRETARSTRDGRSESSHPLEVNSPSPQGVEKSTWNQVDALASLTANSHVDKLTTPKVLDECCATIPTDASVVSVTSDRSLVPDIGLQMWYFPHNSCWNVCHLQTEGVALLLGSPGDSISVAGVVA
jgi:hypothetical protein